MASPALTSLQPLASRRFQSFAEAADAALVVLGALPGTIVVGQVEADDQLLKVLDARGNDGLLVERGAMLRLRAPAAAGAPGNAQLAAYRGDDLDPDLMRSLGVAERATLPIELSDGAVVGLVSALSAREGVYSSDHLVLLGLAARMLSYEWERVSMRAELRQLRQTLTEDTHIDAETGLTDRVGLIEKLTREWRLARRGTVESIVAVCRIRVEGEDPARSAGFGMLALKDAAEVLGGVARWTDHVGRTGPADITVVMIGAEGLPSVEAMGRRFAGALERVSANRPYEIGISFGAHPLSEASAPEEALELAERSVGDLEIAGIGAPAGQTEARRV